MKKKPNILIFFTDQLRYDVLGCHGHPMVKTPNIDKLADGGVDFQRTYAQSATCMPSRISLFTGQYPHTTGVLSNSKTVETSHMTTMPTIMRKNGYQNAIIGKSHIGSSTAMGFDYARLLTGVHEGEVNHYAEYLKELGLAGKGGSDSHYKEYDSYVSEIPYRYSRDAWTGDRCTEFLETRDKNRPFLLWASFQRPHAPTCVPFDNPFPYNPDDVELPSYDESFYMSPEGRRPGCENSWNAFDTGEKSLRQAMANYYSLVSMVDEQVGKIIKKLEDERELENTIIVFTSDHGDFCGEFGQFGKNLSTFDVLYRVPLLFYWKGVTDREKIRELTELIDVMPTLLELTGIDIPRSVQGMSMARAIMGSGKRTGIPWEGKEEVFYETSFVKTVRTKTHKLSYCYRENREWGQLYDLMNDPRETINLYGRPDYLWIQNELEKRLLRWLIRTQQPQVHDASQLYPPVPWRWFNAGDEE